MFEMYGDPRERYVGNFGSHIYKSDLLHPWYATTATQQQNPQQKLASTTASSSKRLSKFLAVVTDSVVGNLLLDENSYVEEART